MIVEDKILMKKPNEIKPYTKNPRRNDKTVELLVKIIPKVGFNVPLVIDEKGIIVKGHARFIAAIRLGMTEIPCIVTHADPESIKADRITDNKISEFSEWINDEVLSEIENIDFDIDFEELGFPSVKFDQIPEAFASNESESKVTEENSIPVDKEKKDFSSTPVGQIPKIKKRYYRCVCQCCGHVMFIEADIVEKGEKHGSV